MLGEGSPWIGNITQEVFGGVRQCLGVYHGWEHGSDTGKVLYGEGTEAYQQWQSATTEELVESGLEEMEKRLNLLKKGELDPKAKEPIRW